MLYFEDGNSFPSAINWREENYGRMIAPGLGIYLMSPGECSWFVDAAKQELNVVRRYGMGHAYFKGKFLTNSTKGIYDFAENDFTRYPVSASAMTWQHSMPLMPPTRLRLDSIRATLSWLGVRDRSDASYPVYDTYASWQTPVDTHDAYNIVATRIPSTSIHVPTAQGMAYIVMATDRYDNEGKPL